MKRISPQEIAAGKPLPWSVVDELGRLLLAKGEVVRDRQQLRALVDRGIYREEITVSQRAKGVNERELTPILAGHQRVFQTVGSLRNHLKTLYRIMREPPNSEQQVVTRLERLARGVLQLCQLDSDAALAAVHLHISGDYEYDHPIHAAFLVALLADRCTLAEDDLVAVIAGALTHDIGAVFNPLHNFDKQKGPLTPEQWQIVHRHPERGVEILMQHGVDHPLWLDVVMHHHERLDGSGYPHHLTGDTISRPARMMAVADIYSAMVRPRGHRDEHQSPHTLRTLFMERGSKVDEEITSMFITLLGIYPPGTLLQLVGGEIAVAVRRGENAHEPVIFAIINSQGVPLSRPQRRERPKINCVISANRYKSVWQQIECCFAT
jgi:HD-GYP domain-containing protein (c-di-GMP phosphodiesterase class II)